MRIPWAASLDQVAWLLVGLTLALILFVQGEWYQWAAGAAGIAGLASALAARRPLRTSLDLAALGLLAASAAATIANPGRVAWTELGRTAMALLFAFAALTTFRSQRRIRLLAGLVILAAVLIGTVATHYHALRGFDDRPGLYPVAPQWSGYPEIGLLMALGIGLVAGFAVTASRWWLTAAASIVALLLALHLVATYARASWVGAAVAVASLALWGIRNLRRWRFAVAAIGLGGLAAASAGMASNATFQKMLGELRKPGAAPYSSRLAIYRETIPLVRDHWLVGVGPGRYAEVMRSGYASKEQEGIAVHAHNVVLHVWAERGLFGVAFLMAAWLQGIWLVWRRPKGVGRWWAADLRAGVFGALVAFFVRAMLDHPLDGLATSYRFTLLLWLLLACAAALGSRARLPQDDVEAPDREVGA